MYTVKISEFVEEFKLASLVTSISLDDKVISKSDINRPALQMAGFFEYFDCERIQVIGKVEHTYMTQLDPEIRRKVLKQIFSHNIPFFVVCYNLDTFPEILEFAEEFDVPLYTTPASTSTFMVEATTWLNNKLAERITLHGVLVDIYGEGVLILGDSGIGKSETALELIKRGHRLVADDAVEIKKISHNTLLGTAPPIIKYFLEIRGIGVINLKELFGIACVKQEQTIDLVIKLEMWDDEAEYDRLGLREEYMNILGNDIICNAIPIRPGRNVAVICEAAAINKRQKKMGYNAAEELNKRVFESMNEEE